jgi:hypothetical protein
MTGHALTIARSWASLSDGEATDGEEVLLDVRPNPSVLDEVKVTV